MKILITILSILISLPIAAQNLSSHLWEARLILLLDTSLDKKLLNQQLALLKQNEEGLSERKIVVYQFQQKEYKKGLSEMKEWKIQKKLPAVFDEVSAKKTFTFLLIGLDGGIKMKRNEIIELKEIFTLIDGMPMRRAEMKKTNYQ